MAARLCGFDSRRPHFMRSCSKVAIGIPNSDALGSIPRAHVGEAARVGGHLVLKTGRRESVGVRILVSPFKLLRAF